MYDVLKRISLVIVIFISISCCLNAGNFFNERNDIKVKKGETVSSIVSFGRPVDIAGIVNGDVISLGKDIVLRPTAEVQGNVVAIGGEVTWEDNAKVVGQTISMNSFKMRSIMSILALKDWNFSLLFRIVNFIGFLALALLIVTFAPDYIRRLSYLIESNGLKVPLAGFGVSVLIIPCIVLLVVSLVGIPLVPLGIMAVFLAAVVGFVAVSTIVGRKILSSIKKVRRPIQMEVIAGTIIFELLRFLPFAGAVVIAAAVITGLGAVVFSLFNVAGTPRL